MTQTLTVSVASVRAYLDLNSSASTSQYTDGTIGSNILIAQSFLEKAANRHMIDRTWTTLSPFKVTTNNRLAVPLPGFRTFTSVTKGGAELIVDVNNPSAAAVWALPDVLQTGVYIGLQFRAATGPEFWPGTPGTPYGPWITNPSWYDTAADSPFHPNNLGGGIYLTSLPNDLLIVGSSGYDADSMPFEFLEAVRAYAGWLTYRPASLMTDVALTPQGGILNYSSLPPEAVRFIAAWKIGQQAVSVG